METIVSVNYYADTIVKNTVPLTPRAQETERCDVRYRVKPPICPSFV